MKTFIKKYLKQLLGWVSVMVLIFISIGFANREQSKRQYGEVVYRITNQYENYFIDENDLRSIISDDGGQMIIGNKFDRLNLRQIETQLTSEMFISQAQSYRDIIGNLIVLTRQRKPIGRISRNNAPDAYIGEDGYILPVSQKYTSRVLLITGDFADSLVANETMEAHPRYFNLIERIYNDRFLRAQITQLDIDKNGNIDMYPQVTKQVIEFGQPENIDLKFKKLEVFYKKILPKKGWNHYKRVNLTYSNQIVCE